jgi:hypothetical protein
MSIRAGTCSAAITAIVLAASASSAARAADYTTIPSGVPGGDPYGFVCPQGHRLVGLGLLIDAGPQVVQNLRPSCAPIGFSTRWTAGQTILPLDASSEPANKSINDSLLCPPDTTVNAIAPLLSSGQAARIIGVRLTCRGLGNVRQMVEKAPGFGARFVVGTNSACRSMDSGQGLWGAVNNSFVNRVGLICAENPILRPPDARRPDTSVQRPGSASGGTGGSEAIPTKP